MVRRHPLIAYFALAYAITWPLWIAGMVAADRAGVALSNEDNFHHIADLLSGDAATGVGRAFALYALGQFGPLVSAVVVTRTAHGPAGLRDLAVRMTRWRVQPRWYAVVIALPLALAAASVAAAFVTGGATVGPFTPAVSWAAAVPFLVFMIVFTGLAEEPGWRGFALPHLQAHHTAIRSSWILGIAWGVWHVPFSVYLFGDEPAVLAANLVALTVGIVGWTIVNTWVYNSTESVLLMIVLHGWFNTVQSYLILSQPNAVAQTVYAVLPWAIAIYLSRRYGDADLAAVPRPRWWPDTIETQHPGAGASGDAAVSA
jgi:hypothetical protein